MGYNTKIDWCDSSWNPVTGCLHDCKYCYAKRLAERYGGHDHDENKRPTGAYSAIGVQDLEKPKYIMRKNGLRKAPYPWFFLPTFHRYRLDQPKRWSEPRTIFVCSMADLFGKWVPDEWIKAVFEACAEAPRHRYLFLTKNPDRYGYIDGWDHRYNGGFAKDYMWFGTTVTQQHELKRTRDLACINAHTFLSIEPILERIDLDRYLPTATSNWQCSYCGHYADSYSLHCRSCGREGGYSGSFRKQPVNWIIIGAETGNRKNKVTPQREWIDEIVRVCDEHGIPVFMKESLRNLMGDDFRQEFPWNDRQDHAFADKPTGALASQPVFLEG